mgnify:CR=1 FL=1
MAKKKKATKKAAESLYDLKEEIIEEVQEVVVPASTKPASFKSRKAARAYAKANGGKVVEKGKFYVR